MKDDNRRRAKDGETAYLKKTILEETDIPNPIQGPVKDPDKLVHFMRDIQNSAVPKFWGIYLNKDYISVGNEPLALGEQATPKNFHTKQLFRFHYIFDATRYILLTNHTNDDPSPTDEDRKLIQNLQIASRVLDGVEFYDYVIVSGDRYWSMNVQHGTACRCGIQEHVPGA